jgi:aldose 1-epimerase
MNDGTVVICSQSEELRAEFVPSAGMVCCSLRHHGEELLAGRDGVRAYAEHGSTMGIPLLYPWANRLGGFAYSAGAAGRAGDGDGVVELARDTPLLSFDSNGLPMHGVIPRYMRWELLGDQPAGGGRRGAAQGLRALMRWDEPDLLAVFPFPHEVYFEAQVLEATLTIQTTVRAGTQGAVPVSFGFHPYLTIPRADRRSWRLELPLTRRLVLDGRMIPTGASEPLELRRSELGDSSWDDAFSGLASPTIFAASAAGRRIELEFLEGYRYAQVFSPAGENFICFEPMTAPTNALVSRIDLPWAAAGDDFRAAFRISALAER